METTIRINTDSITPEIIEGIKKLFPHETVEITIQPVDATEYIFSNPAYMKELEERIETYKAKKEVISLKAHDIQ